jgi:hypothetical protein
MTLSAMPQARTHKVEPPTRATQNKSINKKKQQVKLLLFSFATNCLIPPIKKTPMEMA